MLKRKIRGNKVQRTTIHCPGCGQTVKFLYAYRGQYCRTCKSVMKMKS